MESVFAPCFFALDGLPAVLYGPAAQSVYLYIHGQSGCKEEAAAFASLACPAGYQVLAIDLPGHGARRDTATLTPWEVIPELQAVQRWAAQRYQRCAVRATSIGAYFARLALEPPHHALLVSPILDMEALILQMMQWAGVSEAQLRREGEIETCFGQTLSWPYLTWVRAHPTPDWRCPIYLLYAGQDNMTRRATVDAFVKAQGAQLTVMENGEHWFHTPEQLTVLTEWERACIEKERQA